jgi:hypothetical protein
MNPLILHFRTISNERSNVDESLLEYNSQLQLSVIKSSGLPAFDYISLKTMTGTKAHNEDTDSDYAHSKITPNLNSANVNLENDLAILLATKTVTLSVESTDADTGPKMNKLLLGTMTLTRANTESTDSDV